MILVTLRVRVPKAREGDILRSVAGLAGPTRVLPGCLAFRWYRDLEDDEVLLVEVRWRERESLERHIRSNGFRTVLSILEAASEPPEVEFHEISHTTNIETIEQVRGVKL